MTIPPDRHARAVLRLLWITLILGSAGCVTTTTLVDPVQLHSVQPPPDRILVRGVGDTAWTPLIQYRTTPDSLLGSIPGSSAPGTPLRRLELPFDSVATIRIQRKDVARTAAIPVVTGIVVAMAAWIMVSP